MTIEMPGSPQVPEGNPDILELIMEQFNKLEPNQVAQVQLSDIDGVWRRDSSAYGMRMENSVLSFTIPNDAGQMEKYESVDELGSKFKNTVTDQEYILDITFPER